MKKIKVIAALMAAATLTATAAINAYADSGEYSREEIIELLWEETWYYSPVGEENVRASLDYKQLNDWLDKYYLENRNSYRGDERDYVPDDWSNDSDIYKGWREYRDDLFETMSWEEDDETGEMYLYEYDPDTHQNLGVVYTFNFADGMWQMTDKNGNIVDTFEPHGGIGEEEDDYMLSDEEVDEFIRDMGNGNYEAQLNSGAENADSEQSVEGGDSQRTASPPEEGETAVARVTGGSMELATEDNETETEKAEEVTEDTSSEETEQSGTSAPIMLGAAVVAVVAVVVYFITKGRKKKK